MHTTSAIDWARQGTYTIPAQERVVFGQPAGAALAAEVLRLGAQRVLVTSSASLARLADGPLQQVCAALGHRLAGVSSGMRAHSPREDVLQIAHDARRVQADLLVAVGGGSVIDGTKAALVCLWHGLHSPQDLAPYSASASPRDAGVQPMPIQPPNGAAAHTLRLLAVPTMLAAAEFTATAGVTDLATRAKQSFRHRLLVPQAVVLDPAATLPVPLALLLPTGIRAVDHAVESCCSSQAHALTAMHALQGLQLLAQALPAIVADPHALAPRADAQLGMWQAIWGSATGAGTGASHGIGYALGAGFGVAHGHTSCVMLPAVLRWNEAVNADRQALLAQAMGRPGDNAAQCVADLVRGLGLPGSLQALGIPFDQLDLLAERAMGYAVVHANPRSITQAAQVREILEIAWAGL